MARITVEDCLAKVGNRFLIVQMAIKRGAGKIVVNARKKLSASLSGAGVVEYIGDPVLKLEHIHKRYGDIVQAIGNTPLIRLKGPSAETGCTILGKAEFLNPGQSVKDRPALSMIRRAEERGDIRPGDRLIEATEVDERVEHAAHGRVCGHRQHGRRPNANGREHHPPSRARPSDGAGQGSHQ